MILLEEQQHYNITINDDVTQIIFMYLDVL